MPNYLIGLQRIGVNLLHNGVMSMRYIVVFVNTICLTLLLCSNTAAAKSSEPLNYHTAAGKVIDSIEKKHLNGGNEKFKKGRFEFAWQEYASILHFIPNHPKALEQIGLLSLQMEKPQQAKRYFERAISLFDDPSSHNLYARFLLDNKQYELAQTHLERAIALGDQETEGFYQLALHYWLEHDYSQAQQYLSLALAHKN